MTQAILVFSSIGVTEAIIILIVIAIPVAMIIIFVRLLLRNKKENIRLRLEVSKLADELEQARKQKESGEDKS